MDGPNEAEPDRRCPWCSAEAAADASHCPACGAALAQRESIADLVIAGVTTVDPALAAYAAQPLRLRAASPTQGMAGGVILVGALGGPVGLAAIGGLAAIASAEYVGARHPDSGGRVDNASLGRPSEAALLAVERLENAGETVSRHPPGAADLPEGADGASG